MRDKAACTQHGWTAPLAVAALTSGDHSLLSGRAKMFGAGPKVAPTRLCARVGGEGILIPAPFSRCPPLMLGSPACANTRTWLLRWQYQQPGTKPYLTCGLPNQERLEQSGSIAHAIGETTEKRDICKDMVGTSSLDYVHSTSHSIPWAWTARGCVGEVARPRAPFGVQRLWVGRHQACNNKKAKHYNVVLKGADSPTPKAHDPVQHEQGPQRRGQTTGLLDTPGASIRGCGPQAAPDLRCLQV
jgi:hypothetical protein